MRLLLAAALVAACGLAAHAQVLYKWTDENGRVQYSDKPPKNFKGLVEKLEPPPPAQPAAVPAAPPPTAPSTAPAAAPKAPAAPAEPVSIAAQRKATRERLQAGIDAAQARLDAAKKALAEVQPGEDERQVIQQFPANTPGSLPASKRSNCTTVAGANGKPAVRCAALIPNPAYYERVQSLEEEVRLAEQALAEAEGAYRRGVD